MSTGPIGIFDSGVGGLSVLLEVRRALPHEDLLYVADSGHAPYGEKPAAFIEHRATTIVTFFIEQGAKAVVVACNTATGIAIEALRAQWPMPIIGIEPAIKPAVAVTTSGVIGVLATSQTIASARFARLAGTFASGVEIIAQPCPGLVEQIEQGDLSGDGTRALVEEYVRPLIERGVDTLVLGCTHYGILEREIRSIIGENITLVAEESIVAEELQKYFARHADIEGALGKHRERVFYSTGETKPFRTLGSEFFGLPIEPRRVLLQADHLRA